jgi:hypothetical protein
MTLTVEQVALVRKAANEIFHLPAVDIQAAAIEAAAAEFRQLIARQSDGQSAEQIDGTLAQMLEALRKVLAWKVENHFETSQHPRRQTAV